MISADGIKTKLQLKAEAQLLLRKRQRENPPPPVWIPHPDNHPQNEAYTTEAFETLYGGSAGGGKSDLILGMARTKHKRSLLLRRSYPDLERSLISRSLEFYGARERYHDGKHVWSIAPGIRVEFGHMEKVGTAQVPGDEANYASAPYDFIAYDQLEQFPQYAYEFMISRARSVIGGQKVQIISTANPVGEGVEWIMHRWAAWLDETHPNPAKSGEIRWYKRVNDVEVETEEEDPDGVSRTFIAAGLKDNPYLGEDYRKSLALLPEPLKSALLNGDWKASITDDAYQVVPRSWIKAAQARWSRRVNPGYLTSMGVDVARGGEDQTVIAEQYTDWVAELRRYPGHSTTDGQSVVTLVQQVLSMHGDQDDTPVNIDVIGIGASVYDLSKGKMRANGINFAEKSNATDKSGRLHFTNIRAECYWRLREMLDPDSGVLLALPPDNELMGDIAAHRWSMQSNGIKIESKEEVRARLGRSPDSSDALVLCLHSGILPSIGQWTKALKTRRSAGHAINLPSRVQEGLN
jgi:hypothetical protein